MTEEEKKEFEEFLQWKAERAKRLAEASAEQATQAPDSGKEENADATPASSEAKDNADATPASSEGAKDSSQGGNSTALIFIAFVVFIILMVLVLGLGSKGSPTTAEEVAPAYDSTEVIRTDELYQPGNESTALANRAAALKADSIAKAERAAAVKNTIKITSAYLGSPNSASGVDAYFYYKNVSDKVIKYLVWTGYPMNAVGDRVDCEIRGYADFRGRDTGPVNPGKKSGGCWDCAWYNWTAKKLVITKIEIEYMDGSTFTINEDEIDLVR